VNTAEPTEPNIGLQITLGQRAAGVLINPMRLLGSGSWTVKIGSLQLKDNDMMTVNKDRPIEELVGRNAWIIRKRLGNVHVMTPIKDQLRLVRPKNMRDIPVELRRGWALLALETIERNRIDFISCTMNSSADLRNSMYREITRRIPN
jgi:hypothetical protein